MKGGDYHRRVYPYALQKLDESDITERGKRNKIKFSR